MVGDARARALAAEPPGCLVVGLGGLGGVITGHLVAAGARVTALSRDARVASAVRRGLEIRGASRVRQAPPPEVLEDWPDADRRFDFVVLATQPTDVEAAAEGAVPYLHADSRVVCLQNGLCELRVAAKLGQERVIGAVVAWGATRVGPAVFDQTSRGGFTLGRLAEPVDQPLRELARLFASIGPVTITSNLLGVRWSKLAINCAVSTLGTLGGAPLGRVLRSAKARRLALEIVSECVRVARADGITLEPVSGTVDLERLELQPEAAESAWSVTAKHLVILLAGARYRRMTSSMLRAIRRGRPPAIDYLNGEVVRHGQRCGIPTPVSAAAVNLVWAAARGEVEPRLALIDELHALTR